MNHEFIDIIEQLIDIRLGNISENNYSRNSYNHIAAVITKNRKNNFNVLSVGLNSTKCDNISIHAEYSAISKLKNSDNVNKNNKVVDLLVIRTTLCRKLGNSKPCVKCLECMFCYATKKGYKVNNVYYSTADGTIQKKKLLDLIFNEELHVSRYYKVHNLKHAWIT
jgi:cytidine deaminase